MKLEVVYVQDGTYTKGRITPIAQCGSFIHWGHDNIDVKTETVDGKNMFHKMGTIIMQEQNVDEEHWDKIPHQMSPTLEISPEDLSLMTPGVQ